MKRDLMRRRTAARQLANLITKKCELAANEIQVFVDEEDNRVLVSWESGPFEWAVALLGGSSIYAGEFGDYGTPNKWYDRVERIAQRKRVFFECQNSFQISVWED